MKLHREITNELIGQREIELSLFKQRENHERKEKRPVK